jgi:hypothetical protein
MMVNPKGQCEAWERMTFDAETNEATKCFLVRWKAELF